MAKIGVLFGMEDSFPSALTIGAVSQGIGSGYPVLLGRISHENIDFEAYYRCYCIDRQHVKIMAYEPRNESARRYEASHPKASAALEARLIGDTLKLNRALGYDMNTCEFAVRDGVPVAIDFMNGAPDCDRQSVGEENFRWVVEATAQLLLDRALWPRRPSPRSPRPAVTRPLSRAAATPRFGRAVARRPSAH